MEQSTFPPPRPAGFHLAVIMDGNGRWGLQRHGSRLVGHRAGARALRRVVEAAPALGVGTLTVYAFSADNWQRPAPEVTALMRLFGSALRREAREAHRHGVRLSVIGRRDRLSAALVATIERAEALTAGNTRLHLRIALDYSSRDAILEASRRRETALDREAFARRLAAPDVDLLVRTGGEQRLSDFLLWECAYAELYFTPCLWPDFGPDELAQAIAEFQARERRFGGLPHPAGAAPSAPDANGPVLPAPLMELPR